MGKVLPIVLFLRVAAHVIVRKLYPYAQPVLFSKDGCASFLTEDEPDCVVFLVQL